MKKDLDIKHRSSPSLEINLIVRDSEGNPTGRRKSFRTNSPFKLWSFWARHQGRPKRKKNKPKKGEKLPTDQEAQKIMKDMYSESSDD